MPTFQLQLLRADGQPAADALVSVAAAPGPTLDLGLVADAAGRLSIDGPAGAYSLSIWLDGRAHRLPCTLPSGPGSLVLRLPG